MIYSCDAIRQRAIDDTLGLLLIYRLDLIHEYCRAKGVHKSVFAQAQIAIVLVVNILITY